MNPNEHTIPKSTSLFYYYCLIFSVKAKKSYSLLVLVIWLQQLI